VNPVAVIAHVLAVVAGIWGGLSLMGWIAPDLPDPDEAAGLTATAPEEITGSSEDSLFRQTPLHWAMERLADQLGAGEQVVYLQIYPGKLESETRDAQDSLIDPGDVVASAPEWIVTQIAEKRPDVTLDKVRYMGLIATAEGPRWYVELVRTDPKITAPWAYTADAEGDLLEAGGAVPLPLAPE
jgi:hypothetical protein